MIDSQSQELNDKFNDNMVELLILNDNMVELLILSSAVDPREMHTSFRIDDICKLVKKFYPQDFAEYEMIQLRMQFEYFDHVRQLWILEH